MLIICLVNCRITFSEVLSVVDDSVADPSVFIFYAILAEWQKRTSTPRNSNYTHRLLLHGELWGQKKPVIIDSRRTAKAVNCCRIYTSI